MLQNTRERLTTIRQDFSLNNKEVTLQRTGQNNYKKLPVRKTIHIHIYNSSLNSCSARLIKYYKEFNTISNDSCTLLTTFLIL